MIKIISLNRGVLRSLDIVGGIFCACFLLCDFHLPHVCLKWGVPRASRLLESFFHLSDILTAPFPFPGGFRRCDQVLLMDRL